MYIDIPHRFLVVALRKESVDRNGTPERLYGAVGVALRKESVDRNPAYHADNVVGVASLSARRAWIEIASW